MGGMEGYGVQGGGVNGWDRTVPQSCFCILTVTQSRLEEVSGNIESQVLSLLSA